MTKCCGLALIQPQGCDPQNGMGRQNWRILGRSRLSLFTYLGISHSNEIEEIRRSPHLRISRGNPRGHTLSHKAL